MDWLVGRIRQLSDAACGSRENLLREFTMSIPAEPQRDADLVLSTAATEIERLRAELAAAKVDAERYAALKTHYKDFAVMENLGHDWARVEPDDMDAAIDREVRE
jgi:hypothetical protein